MSDGSAPAVPSVLIMGAGPAGLSLAFELRGCGVEALLLERGPGVAHSWARMPTYLRLLSPWKANWLPGIDRRRFRANSALTRAEYCAALQEHAVKRQFSVQTNAGVEAVTCRAGGFLVRTGSGTFQAPLLVNATGYFSNPFVPEFPGARESLVPQFHFATYGDPERLRDALGRRGGRVLIVGRRLSAGQAMLELVDAGFEVALSCRGRIRFGAGPVGAWVFFRLHPLVERWQLRFRGDAARGVEVRMPGGRGRRLIERGTVKVFPEIAKFEAGRVFFRDGRALEPDAVIYATGFRPALGHLSALGLDLDPRDGRPALRGFESVKVPGLFFLGLDQVRNFRSRFLRGIREDAAILARELAARVGSGAGCRAKLVQAAGGPSNLPSGVAAPLASSVP